MLSPKKVNILVDGQFGSTGKGLMAGYIATKSKIDIAVSNCSPNAGHTCIIGGKKIICHQLPISGVINTDAHIFFTAGSIIDPEVLFQEMEEYGVKHDRVSIHPRAAVVNDTCRSYEHDLDNPFTGFASTRSGTGAAMMRKVARGRGGDDIACIAEQCESLKPLIYELKLNMCINVEGKIVFMETSQGYGLGINSGYKYPYVTSREVSIGQFLSDAQVHPSYLGRVIMTMRTYPIRVGHIMDGNHILGNSGPFYYDGKELSWNTLGVEPELTTLTKRPRRIAKFSITQMEEACEALQPDVTFLNFCNYMDDDGVERLASMITKETEKPLLLGYGPSVEDIRPYVVGSLV